MWSLIHEIIKDIDSLIRRPYLPTKEGLVRIKKSMDKTAQHWHRQNELRQRLAQAYCKVAKAEESGASSEEMSRLLKSESSCAEELAKSELVADDLRLESSLIAWNVYGKKRPRLVKILEDANEDRISIPPSHDANLMVVLEELMASHQKGKIEKLKLLLEEFDNG